MRATISLWGAGERSDHSALGFLLEHLFHYAGSQEDRAVDRNATNSSGNMATGTSRDVGAVSVEAKNPVGR
jgi:hypothetical protein